MGFMSVSDRLLRACSRARDSLLVLCNYTSLLEKEHKRKLGQLDKLQVMFEKEKAYMEYDRTPLDFDFAALENS